MSQYSLANKSIFLNHLSNVITKCIDVCSHRVMRHTLLILGLAVGLSGAVYTSVQKHAPQSVTLSVPGLTLNISPRETLLQLPGGAGIGIQFMGLDSSRGNLLPGPGFMHRSQRSVQIAYQQGLTAWYRVQGINVEQGFILSKPLGKTLVLNFALKGQGLNPHAVANGIEWVDRRGYAVLHYGGMSVKDADQKTLPSYLTLAGNQLRLHVNLEFASYPVVVDPLFSRVATLTDPNTTNSAAYNNVFGMNAVAMSADGKTVLVGAPSDSVGSVLYAGKAYIYTFSNSTWTLTNEFDDPDGDADVFGSAVALSADGTLALIGSRAAVIPYLGFTGKAYLYALNNNTWTQVHEFDDPDNKQVDSYGRTGVAISADGTTVLIADTTTGVDWVNEGKIYIYSQSSGVWNETAAIPDPDMMLRDYFGSALSLNSSGTLALIGSHASVIGQDANGKAYLYSLNNGTWTQAYEFDDPAAQLQSEVGDQFGFGVALSSDGLTALISAPDTEVNKHFLSGAVYLYTSNGGSWDLMQTITDPDGDDDDYFGSSVALSADGMSALVGSNAAVFGQKVDGGKAYLYSLAGSQWTESYEFDDPEATSNDYFGLFGMALSNDGSTSIIDSRGATINGIQGAGAVYMYQPWTEAPIDLSLSMSANPSSTLVNQNVTIQFQVNNNDNQLTATNLILTSPTYSNYVSVNEDGGNCAYANGIVVCTLSSLAPQAVWQPSFIYHVNPLSGGANSISFTSVVSASEPDSNSVNNETSVNINVSTGSTGGSGSSSGGGGGTSGLLSLLSLGLLFFIRTINRS